MNLHCLMKSILTLVLFTANLTLISQANAENSNLKIHIAPETDELVQKPAGDNQTNQERKTTVTRQLLSIKASPVIGGGFIVTPDKTSLAQISIHINKNGHMQTFCR